MHSLQNIEPYEIVNASYEADANFLKEEGDLTHLIGILTTEDQVSNQLAKVQSKPILGQYFQMKDHSPLRYNKQWQKYIQNGFLLPITK